MKPKFKNQQQVVCIKISEYNPTIFPIKVNNIYKIEGSTEDEYIKCPTNDCENDIYYHLSYGEYELIGMFHEDNFISIKEYRKQKLQKINSQF